MENRVKILFVIPNSQISGAEHQLLLLIKNMNTESFDIQTCCLDGNGPFSDYVKNIGLTSHVIDRNKSFEFLRLKKLYRLIKINKYDIIVAFCWSAIQYTRLCSFILPSKHIACERGHDYNKVSIVNIISRLLDPISDRIVFNSKIQMSKYLKNFRFKNIPVETIYNGINVNSFQKKKKISLNKFLNISPDIKLIGTVGNFTRVKNFQMFIEVCENVTRKYSNVHFLAIGDGPDREGYESIVKSKKLENKLTFLGFRNEINELLPNLDIFLLTSNREGMPNVVMEAMACKVPVISTSVDGSKELIDNDKNGFLVKRNDVSMMVEKISKIINNPKNIHAITNNAYEKISKDLSVKKMVEQYQSIFISVYEKK